MAKRQRRSSETPGVTIGRAGDRCGASSDGLQNSFCNEILKRREDMTIRFYCGLWWKLSEDVWELDVTLRGRSELIVPLNQGCQLVQGRLGVRTMRWRKEGQAGSSLGLLSTVTDVVLSKIKGWQALVYFVYSVNVVVWGWPRVVLRHFWCAATPVETLQLTSSLKSIVHCDWGDTTVNTRWNGLSPLWYAPWGWLETVVYRPLNIRNAIKR